MRRYPPTSGQRRLDRHRNLAAAHAVTGRMESVEVTDAAGNVVGYALLALSDRDTPLTPTRDSRTAAWADAEHVRWVNGRLAYCPPALSERTTP